MLRGEVWWARIPTREADSKRRPMLIVSDDAFNNNERYSKVMVVHLTTVKRLGGAFDWEVALPRGAAGLARSSIVKCGEIYTLHKDQLQAAAGTISPQFMQLVDRALAVALSLPRPAGPE